MRNKSKIRSLLFVLITPFFFSNCTTEGFDDFFRTPLDLGPSYIELSDDVVLKMIQDALQYNAVGLNFDVVEIGKLSAPILLNPEPSSQCSVLEKIQLDYETTKTSPLLGHQGYFWLKLHCDEHSLPFSMEVDSKIIPEYRDSTNHPNGFYATENTGYWIITKDTSETALLSFSGRNNFRVGKYFYNIHSTDYYRYRITFKSLSLTFNAQENVIVSGSAKVQCLAFVTSSSNSLLPFEKWGSIKFLNDGRIELILSDKIYYVNVQ